MTTWITSWPWLAVAAMGAYHGLNPAMGWLFAVSLGLQERSRARLIGALAPIAIGHLASIAIVVALFEGGELVISPRSMQILGGLALAAFGAFRLVSSRFHYRWVGMRVSSLDLILWSFLMASAHGAGLMLFPVLIAMPICRGAIAPTSLSAGFPGASAIAKSGVILVAIHTATMLLVMGAVAIVVYDKVGVGILRRAWVNVDKLWAATLMGAGLIVLAV